MVQNPKIQKDIRGYTVKTSFPLLFPSQVLAREFAQRWTYKQDSFFKKSNLF